MMLRMLQLTVLFWLLFSVPDTKANDIYNLYVYKTNFVYLGVATLSKSIFGWYLVYKNGKKHFVKSFDFHENNVLKIAILSFTRGFIYAKIRSVSQ